MVMYKHEVDDEEFEALQDARNKDNVLSAEYLNELAQSGKDAHYNLSLLHLGIMMQILGTTLDIKQNEIQKLFELKKDETRDRKMEGIIKELNEKINLRYEFDSKTEIIPCLYTYKGDGYFICEKLQFLQLLNNNEYDEESILDNL